MLNAATPMNQVELFTFGVLWRNYRNEQAGRELVRALRSPETRDLARMLLREAGPRLVPLIQSALDAGEIRVEDAADCMSQSGGPAPVAVTWNLTTTMPMGSGCSGVSAPISRPQLVQLMSA